ncbi:hypothetical protein V6K52_12450 [Knoellia sp. S7-12]|uniref:hypothetical protein n=1 Tax=Knoellia sp. S7-12 TaxID=3126698 RepID=UPI003368AA0E
MGLLQLAGIACWVTTEVRSGSREALSKTDAPRKNDATTTTHPRIHHRPGLPPPATWRTTSTAMIAAVMRGRKTMMMPPNSMRDESQEWLQVVPETRTHPAADTQNVARDRTRSPFSDDRIRRDVLAGCASSGFSGRSGK